MSPEDRTEEHAEDRAEGIGARARPHIPAGVAAASVARWALVAVMAAVAIASVAYARGAFDRDAGAGHTAAAGEKVLYQCPMHPQIVRDHPGECPICGMTLIRVVRKSSSSPAGASPSVSSSSVPGLVPIELTPDRIQLAGVRTAKVVRRPLRSVLRATGVVAANERGLAEINTRFAGWIQDLFVSETGARVKKGQALATIFSPDVLSAQQEFLTARKWSTGPTRTEAAPAGAGAGVHTHESLTAGMADDARKRLDLLGIAPQEIDEIARTGQPVRAVTVRSPVAGTVIRRGAVAGGYVQPGSELFAIADLGTVWFIAEVYEHESARVRVGQTARVALSGLPGVVTKGRVQFIYPAVSVETRTLRIRIEVRNAGGQLRPGMYGTVELDLAGAQGLAVPAEAVVDTGETQYLFVAKEGGRFEPRRVKVGARGDGTAEILDGIAEGETVVTTANFLLDSESRLRAAVEGIR
jgi:Cu(I)/Ag(I) efflux system membrane fusion protein